MEGEYKSLDSSAKYSPSIEQNRMEYINGQGGLMFCLIREKTWTLTLEVKFITYYVQAEREKTIKTSMLSY